MDWFIDWASVRGCQWDERVLLGTGGGGLQDMAGMLAQLLWDCGACRQVKLKVLEAASELVG